MGLKEFLWPSWRKFSILMIFALFYFLIATYFYGYLYLTFGKAYVDDLTGIIRENMTNDQLKQHSLIVDDARQNLFTEYLIYEIPFTAGLSYFSYLNLEQPLSSFFTSIIMVPYWYLLACIIDFFLRKIKT